MAWKQGPTEALKNVLEWRKQEQDREMLRKTGRQFLGMLTEETTPTLHSLSSRLTD